MTLSTENRDDVSNISATTRLKKFAYLGNLTDMLADLASLAESESWDYQNSNSEYKKPILFSYLSHTFARIEDEKKIELSEDNQHACFNTGLVTPNQEAIYAVFIRNQNQDKQEWRLQSFVRGGEYNLNRFQNLPLMAHYFDDPSELIFNPTIELRINYDHIIADNKERFPVPYSQYSDYQLKITLKGAIDSSIERIKRNYKAAIPQYHKGRIQLLIPLCLSQPAKADLAIVLERLAGSYRATTCLTLDMAYNNARLLARPDRDWLQP